jgi:hypothetical protein
LSDANLCHLLTRPPTIFTTVSILLAEVEDAPPRAWGTQPFRLRAGIAPDGIRTHVIAVKEGIGVFFVVCACLQE